MRNLMIMFLMMMTSSDYEHLHDDAGEYFVHDVFLVICAIY